jgi:hypothetical protein
MTRGELTRCDNPPLSRAYNRQRSSVIASFISYRGILMSLLESGVRFAAGRMPKLIKPRTHAVLDYAVVGVFLAMGTQLWKRNRRAAVGSLLCGGAAALNAMITDYPGGVVHAIDYSTHGSLDAGLAALTAAAPRLLGFADEDEARFFNFQALAETVITSLTDYDYYEEEEGI